MKLEDKIMPLNHTDIAKNSFIIKAELAVVANNSGYFAVAGESGHNIIAPKLSWEK